MNPVVIWSKYPLTQEFWEKEFATKDKKGRCQLLREKSLEYKYVPRCEKCVHVWFHCVCGNKEYLNKMNKTRNELKKSFDEKLRFSEEIVSKVLSMATKYNLKIALAYSGGFDSECCLQLFRDAIKSGQVTIIVGNTLSDLPETRKRWKEAEEELGVKFIYAVPETGVSFKTNAIKHGLPIFSRSGYLPKNLSRATKNCCQNLKEKPQAKLSKNFDITILGFHIDENQYRNLTIKSKGECYFSKDGKWHVYPIAYWTNEDEWKFQKLRGFKYNGIYDHTNIDKKGFFKLSNGKLYQIRSGCGFCPQSIYSGYLEWLETYYKDSYYRALIKLYNDVGIAQGIPNYFEKVKSIIFKQDVTFSPCHEGKPMNHAIFQDEKLFSEFVRILPQGFEVHNEFLTVCVPKTCKKNTFWSIVNKARANLIPPVK